MGAPGTPAVDEIDRAAPLRVEHAAEPGQFETARRLRNAVYRRRLGLDLDGIGREIQRDRAGHVFLLYRAELAVACGRSIPVRSPLCELRELGRLPPELADDPEVCEVGRIATTGGTGPNGVPYGAALLCLGARWLVEHTRLRRYVAYCRTPLVAWYEAVGAVDLNIRFRLPGRGDAAYALVVGDLATPARLAARLDGSAPVSVSSARD